MKELKMYEDSKLDHYIVHEVHISIFISAISCIYSLFEHVKKFRYESRRVRRGIIRDVPLYKIDTVRKPNLETE